MCPPPTTPPGKGTHNPVSPARSTCECPPLHTWRKACRCSFPNSHPSSRKYHPSLLNYANEHRASNTINNEIQDMEFI